jgi:FKBP-type peptidyl-prolyl cis-trans isomerase
MWTSAAVAAALVSAGAAPRAAGAAAETPGPTVTLPGIAYQVLASGPAEGPHPKRSDTVSMRYLGHLQNGEVFSTSPQDGRGLATFGVGQVIPGMSAALQLMRPGDRWRITMPPYLAYGPGRAFTPPASGVQAVQRRGIPSDATLVFDVELVGISPPKTP